MLLSTQLPGERYIIDNTNLPAAVFTGSVLQPDPNLRLTAPLSVVQHLSEVDFLSRKSPGVLPSGRFAGERISL
jgi:hypothetical protein